MAGSLTNLLYHLVFSTKLRQPLIEAPWRAELYAYLGGILQNEGGVLIAAGGTPDHIHLLVRLGPTMPVSDAMRVIKANSSRWARQRRRAPGRFQWQAGYGAFTVSESKVPQVRSYIEEQEQHHRKLTFQEEFVKLLRQHGVRYDERYLWN